MHIMYMHKCSNYLCEYECSSVCVCVCGGGGGGGGTPPFPGVL